MKIYRKNTIVQIDKDDGTRVFLNPPFCRLRKFEEIYEIHDSQKLERHLLGRYDEVEDEYGNTFATAQDFENYITGFINFNTGGGVGFLSGTVDVYSNLPAAVDHNGEFWLVTQSSGGLLSWMGVYKYPKGVYSPNTLGIWEITPINVRTAEDSLTLINITNWAEFYAFVTDINIGDRITYQQRIYKNLTGALTTSAPDIDTVNWVGYNDFTDSYKTQVDANTAARHMHLYQFAISEPESNTTSAAYQQKLRLTTSDLPAGLYRICWAFNYSSDDENEEMLFQVQVNDLITVFDGRPVQKKKITNGVYNYLSGAYPIALSGINNIDLDFANSNGKTTYIKNALLEVWRVQE